MRDEEHLQRQIAAIRDYCEERGIVVAEIVTARGQSGMRPFDTRGGLMVKETVENDTIDMLIATDTSRLSRDTKDLTNLVHWMSHHDMRIFVFDEDASRVPESGRSPLANSRIKSASAYDWAL